MQRKSISRYLSAISTAAIALLLILAGPGPATLVDAQSATAATCGTAYTVQSGDTMFGIARACGVNYADLLAANNGIADPNLIFPGQILNIPSGGSIPTTGGTNNGGSTYTVVSGDTLSSIAANKGVSLSNLEAANPGIANPNLIFPGQVINIPTGGSIPSTGGTNNGTTYTVQPGDTLFSISSKFNTTVPLLMQMNPSIKDMNVIFPGQVLTVR